jgi:hypothetical protein
MDTKTILHVGFRILGLLFLYHGLLAAPRVVSVLLKLSAKFQFEPLLSSVLACAWPLLLAVWFLRGAPGLMRFVDKGGK